MRDPKRQGPVRQAAGSCPRIAQTCVMIFGLNLLLAGIMKGRARNLEESEIERRKMNLKAVEQLPDSVVHLTYLTKQKLD